MHDIGIPLKTGQSEIIRISQDDFIYGMWDENQGITETLATHEDADEFYTMVSLNQ